MAYEVVLNRRENEIIVIRVSRQEAVAIISLLSAQLGDVPLCGNHIGASPVLDVSDGKNKYKLALTLEGCSDG